MTSPPIPPAPRIALAVARDRTADARATGGFVNLRRVDLVARYPDGTTSPPFAYDVVERAAIDAVVLVAYTRDREVYLRSCTRAPIQLRDGLDPDASHLWELPAGLVDPHETPREAASRELEEELGFKVPPQDLEELGGFTWPAPGFVAERHFYFCADVTDHPPATPTEDGSALERGALVVRRPVGALLALCRAGALPDAKTELALRRFVERP